MIFYRWENSSVLLFSWTHSFWNSLLFSIWIGCSRSYCIIVIMGLFFSVILGMICLILFPESCGFLFLKDYSDLRMSSLRSHVCARLAWYRIQDFEALSHCLLASINADKKCDTILIPKFCVWTFFFFFKSQEGFRSFSLSTF